MIKKVFKKTTTTVYAKKVEKKVLGKKGKRLTKKKEGLEMITHKVIGKLDMVIAFDTTGSMAAYIEDVRQQVAELIPKLFKDNDDLRLGIVAFGDYCDMNGKDDYGDAYQCLPLTNNENDIIKFIKNSKDTGGGDGDEFYELVIKKIVEETEWRDDSTRNILLISDAEPHELGYTYKDYVVKNQIDWKHEARKAAKLNIKIDTVTIDPLPWYKELSKMTNGISVPFSSSSHTSDLIMAGAYARGSAKQRMKFDKMAEECNDKELGDIFCCFSCARMDE